MDKKEFSVIEILFFDGTKVADTKWRINYSYAVYWIGTGDMSAEDDEPWRKAVMGGNIEEFQKRFWTVKWGWSR